ncbi:MAG: hypothetical protein ACREBH_02020 [Candidatus Micrarchaeaceae archaeon]
MGIDESKCDVCGEDLTAENYYYVYAGRLQQGPQSDKKSMLEYTLCSNCYTQIKAELMVSVQRRKGITGKQE